MSLSCKFVETLWNQPLKITKWGLSRILYGPGTKSRHFEGPETFWPIKWHERQKGPFWGQKSRGLWSFIPSPSPRIWILPYICVLYLHIYTSGRGMFEIYNIPQWCLKFQTYLQISNITSGEEIVKSTLFCKVCYVLYSGIKKAMRYMTCSEKYKKTVYKFETYVCIRAGCFFFHLRTVFYTGTPDCPASDHSGTGMKKYFNAGTSPVPD